MVYRFCNRSEHGVECAEYSLEDVVVKPVQKIYAVFSKMYMDEKYSLIEKMDKSFVGKEILFSGEIEKLLER